MKITNNSTITNHTLTSLYCTVPLLLIEHLELYELFYISPQMSIRGENNRKHCYQVYTSSPIYCKNSPILAVAVSGSEMLDLSSAKQFIETWRENGANTNS